MRIMINQGFGLIETLTAVVVLSVGLTGLMALYFSTASSQVEPVIETQARMIAQNYLDRLIVSGMPTGKTQLVSEKVDKFHVIVKRNPPETISHVKMQQLVVSVQWQNREWAQLSVWVAAT